MTVCKMAVLYNATGPGCGIQFPPDEGCSQKSLDGITETGICDMIGNLWEWVDTKCEDGDDNNYIDCESIPTEGQYYYIKGGAYDTPFWGEKDDGLSIKNVNSIEHAVEPHNPNRMGFRCVIDEETYNRCK